MSCPRSCDPPPRLRCRRRRVGRCCRRVGRCSRWPWTASRWRPPALPAAGPRPVLPAAGARPVLLATGTRPGLPTATLSGRRPPPIVPLPRGRIHPRRESRPHPGSPTLADTSSDTTGSTPVCLGVDVGGTNIKVGLVDLREGELIGDRLVTPTPQPATPDAVAETIRQMVGEFEWNGPVGVAVPTVIHEGVARIAHNIDSSWIGCDVVELFDRHLPGRTV